MPAERLQKILARAGAGRREAFIAKGRVTVDGQVAIRLVPGRARRLTPQEVKYLAEPASKPAPERKASRAAAAPKSGRKPRPIGHTARIGGRPKKKRSRRKS